MCGTVRILRAHEVHLLVQFYKKWFNPTDEFKNDYNILADPSTNTLTRILDKQKEIILVLYYTGIVD